MKKYKLRLNRATTIEWHRRHDTVKIYINLRLIKAT